MDRAPSTHPYSPRLLATHLRSPCRAGYLGVYESSVYERKTGGSAQDTLPFRAEVKGKALGTFATKVEAATAYARAVLPPPARLQQRPPAPPEPRSAPARESRKTAPGPEPAVAPRPKRAVSPKRAALPSAEPSVEPRLQGHCQSPPRDEAEEPAERGGRAKRAKLCRRYDNLPREGTDSEGHVWALIPDPRAEGAHYNGFDGTGYKGEP